MFGNQCSRGTLSSFFPPFLEITLVAELTCSAVGGEELEFPIFNGRIFQVPPAHSPSQKQMIRQMRPGARAQRVVMFGLAVSICRPMNLEWQGRRAVSPVTSTVFSCLPLSL